MRLFARDDDSGALEFTRAVDGKWSRKSFGKANRPFFETTGGSKTALIFTDPISLLLQFGTKLFSNRYYDYEILGLMEPDERLTNQFIAGHKRVDKIFFVTSNHPDRSGHDLDFFNVLKGRYARLGVQLHLFTDDKQLTKALEKEGRDHGLSR